MCMIAHDRVRMTEDYTNVNHLVLNFYPDGYSIAVKLNEFPVFTSETILETAKISYEETGLLDYIANEELPPLLVEMIDNSPKLSQYKIWRDGCLVLEVRDKIELTSFTATSSFEESHNDINENYHKRSQCPAKVSNLAHKTISQTTHWYHNYTSNHHNHNHHSGIDHNHGEPTLEENRERQGSRNYFVVLKPTNLSMLYDVLNLTSSKCWSAQQRLQLESQIVLHNSPNLSLEPNATKEPSALLDDDSKPNTGSWASSDDTTKTSGTCSNKYSRFDSIYNHRLPTLKNRLKSIYLNRPIQVSRIKTTNGNQVSTHHPKMNNIYHDPSSNLTTTASLPRELTLQQFLAKGQATRKKSLPNGLIPRFHRFKRNVDHK